MAADKKAKRKEEPEAEAPETPEGEGGAPPEPKKKKLSGRFIVLFIALPAVGVIALGLGAAFMFGVFDSKKEAKDAQEAARAEAEHAVFFDMPELLVNMTGGGEKQQNFLKLSLSLELPNAEATPKVQAAMPRIIDSAQVFLRELRLDDLQGSAGMLRLREELMRRINAAVSPVEVRDVLFKEIIVQ
jgi:flagellar protein FliL